MSWINAARAAVFSLAVAIGGCAQSETETPEAGVEQLSIETAAGPVHFTVEIADTEEERARGLMFREGLEDDQGMLFEFQEPEMASFWMRNTIISLDIIFIAPDGRVLNIAERTTPYSEEGIPAAGLTSAVLEIRGGRAGELGIRPGDRVRHRMFES